MKQEHHPSQSQNFNNGAEKDIDKELLGQQNNGKYIDARNMRTGSRKGNAGSLEAINGEELTYDDLGLSPDYQCIGSSYTAGYKIEFWASTVVSEDSIIRIDGDIMAESDGLGFDVNYPLQTDDNEQCEGGEVFVTDNNQPPMIFNIGDIIDNFNLGTEKYFSEYNPDLYRVNLQAPLDVPVLDPETPYVNVGGGGGLPAGMYIYSIRYVDADGNRTNLGPKTPPIPVLRSVSSNSTQFPYVQSFGDVPDISAVTSYGLQLKFRVTNINNYDSIEIVRESYNIGAGIDYVPEQRLVGRFTITPGEVSVRTFLDPRDSNEDEVIEAGAQEEIISYIEKAKAIRYHDKRLVLMNIETGSRETDLQFPQINGETMFPVMKKLGKEGHNDIYNHAYNRNYISGEKVGFAVNVFDSVGSRGFSQPIDGFENYQFPNRREEVVTSSNSDIYSYEGTATAANIDGNVSQTFEAFDLEDAVSKLDVDTFKNVLNKGTKAQSGLYKYSAVDVEDVGGEVNGIGQVKAPYAPYTPRDDSDSVSGHNYIVNPEAWTSTGSSTTYRPSGFGPNYYTKGIALSGVSNLPSWAKSFSITRSKVAGRVVCQGIGMYSLNPGNFSLVNGEPFSKDAENMWFFSPDIDSGLVPSGIIQDVIDNPGEYEVQFVSPLGFFSETYGFEHNGTSPRRSRIVDMVSYARVLHDSGEINPTESGVGVSDYVAYNKYRNTENANEGFFNGSDGNKTNAITSFTSKTDGRNTYYELGLQNVIYQNQFVGGSGNSNFNDSGLKDFTEPFYMVNIIRKGADVSVQNTDEYLSTGAYVKVESVIGVGDGSTNQSYELVDERWEDCIPALDSGDPLASDDAFVYLNNAGVESVYLNVTYYSVGARTAIIDDILLNGSHTTVNGNTVTGVYTHTISSNGRHFTINFDQPGFDSIAEGTVINVRYNPGVPIRIFGGDSVVGESMFAPIDREADADSDVDGQFVFNAGFPMRKYEINPRHYIISNTQGVNFIQNAETCRLSYIRQLCVMFTCEARTSINYAFADGKQQTFFPLTNYVMRPNRYDSDKTIEENDLYSQYVTDYGEEEKDVWKYGGFKMLPQYNLDYSVEPLLEFVSKPKVGFEEENNFCTRIIWSLPRAINVQDAPGLKTFNPSSVFDISDDQGEIKFAYDATYQRGENLYAFTEKGTCLLLTKKSILSDLSQGEIGYMGSDQFISNEYWLDKNIGMNGEMWRSASETSYAQKNELGTVRTEGLFFANNESVFRFSNDTIIDLGENGFKSELITSLPLILPDYTNRVTSFYDEKTS